MPQMDVNPKALSGTTFAQIQEQFGQGKDADHNIRFQDGKGLYTSSKASMTGIKAFFGSNTAMNERVEKRDAGLDVIKRALNREFVVPGLADRAIQRLAASGRDLSHGIRGSDLAALHEAADQIVTEDARAALAGRQLNVDTTRATRGADPANQTLKTKADAALRDPNLASLTSGGFIKPQALMDYCGTHFDVITSAPFFAPNSQALNNSDNFGCALSLSVLNRIEQSGTVTPKDLSDLQKALCPHSLEGSTPAPVPSDTLLGPLTDDHRSQLTKLVFDRYMAPDAPNLINWENRPFQNNVRTVFDRPTATGTEKLAALSSCFDGTMKGQYLGPENMSAPLKSISNMTWGLTDNQLRGVTIT